MGKKLPLLKPREVEANLISLGFIHARTVGAHKQYVRAADGAHRRAVVTVDVGKKQFDAYLMKMMIRQSLLSQEEFCSGHVNEPIAKAAIDANPDSESEAEAELEPVTEEDQNA